MSAFRQKTSVDQFLPVFFSSATFHIEPSLKRFEQFSLFKANFGALATQQNVEELKSHLVEIDIKDEIDLMHSESVLEVTVPVLGIADLLKKWDFKDHPPQFANVVALNGYIAKNTDELNNNFPRCDFIVATDIVGNKFELIVNPDGEIELPDEGTGLFSIISCITFIFSAHQVKDGIGLRPFFENTQKNKICILPATNNAEPYSMTICVTHLNTLRQRIVDSIRHVHIRPKNLSLKNMVKNAQVTKLNDELPDMLRIDVSISDITNYSALSPFAINVMLQPLKGIEYSFIQHLDHAPIAESNSYVKHPIFSNVYTRYVGLSEKAFSRFLKTIYSEHDFIKDYFYTKNLELSKEKGYNNMLLRTEGFKALYNLLIHCLVNHKIPGEFLLKHLSPERFSNLELSSLNFDFHDRMVIFQIQQDLLNNRFYKFLDLFSKESHELQQHIQESFYIYAKGLDNDLPKVTIEVLNQQDFSKNILSYIDRTAFEERFQDISSKALRQSYIDAPELEKLCLTSPQAQSAQDDMLVGLSTYKTLHLNEVVDFSPLMTSTTNTIPAYWVELGDTYEKKGYAFYMKNIFDRETRFQMNVTQVAHNKSYQMATWVRDTFIDPKTAEPNQVPPGRRAR